MAPFSVPLRQADARICRIRLLGPRLFALAKAALRHEGSGKCANRREAGRGRWLAADDVGRLGRDAVSDRADRN